MGEASTKTVPRIVRRSVSHYEWRHVRGIAAIRVVVALWLVTLGVILCANGYWWGMSLFLVAALVGVLASQMPRWKRALDAESGAHAPNAG
jgi:hypothetical protein